MDFAFSFSQSKVSRLFVSGIFGMCLCLAEPGATYESDSQTGLPVQQSLFFPGRMSFVIGARSALAAERGNFNHLLPKRVNGDRYEFDGELYSFLTSGSLDKDKEKDGIKETILTVYKSPTGKRLTVYITNGTIWARGIQIRPGHPGNFVIAETNCDGAFDTKYIGNESFFLPACLKRKR